MTALFVAGLLVCNWAEANAHPAVAYQVAGGNMEGKEVRFGIGGSALAAVVTSKGATGSYNSMHDSFQPLGVTVPLVNMLLGEIVYGGLGTGLYGIIFVALIALFVGGLMIGRTPEYLGKQIDPPEMKIIAVYTLVGPVTVLALTAFAAVTKPGLAGLTTNAGPHGFTEILFAYASAFANNGQSMAGLSANNIFYNTTTIIAMLAGRYILAVLALSLAGRFAAMSRRPPSLGTMPSDGFVFGVLLAGTVLLLGALSFLPALALGPIVEHYSMHPESMNEILIVALVGLATTSSAMAGSAIGLYCQLSKAIVSLYSCLCCRSVNQRAGDCCPRHDPGGAPRGRLTHCASNRRGLSVCALPVTGRSVCMTQQNTPFDNAATAALSQQSNWHRGDRTTVCDPLTFLVAACGVCAACDGFGFARTTTATFDVFYWL